MGEGEPIQKIHRLLKKYPVWRVANTVLCLGTDMGQPGIIKQDGENTKRKGFDETVVI